MTPYWSQVLSMSRYDIVYLLVSAMSVGLIVGMNVTLIVQWLVRDRP